MSFTARDVEVAMSKDKDFYGWGSLGYSNVKLTINGEEYTTTPIRSEGGEDEGSHAEVVFEVGGRLFRKSGYYASHYGYDWDGEFDEVEAYEKTVTDYRPV